MARSRRIMPRRKRRYTRGKKKYAWGVFKRRVLNVMRKSAETKRAFSDTLFSGNVTNFTTGFVGYSGRNTFIFNNVFETILKGDNNNQRQGATIQVSGIKITGQMFHLQPPTDLYIRMILFYQQDQYSTRATVTGAENFYTWPGDTLLLNGAGMSSPDYMFSPFDPKLCKIVKQWRFKLSAGPNNAFQSDNARDSKGALLYFKKYVRFRRKLTYKDNAGIASNKNLTKGQQLYIGFSYDTLEQQEIDLQTRTLGFNIIKTIYYKDY